MKALKKIMFAAESEAEKEASKAMTHAMQCVNKPETMWVQARAAWDAAEQKWDSAQKKRMACE